MAIQDPQAVAFVNKKARVFADALYTVITTAPNLVAAWNNGISTLIPNTTAIVADGASVNGTDATGGDGRRVLTGADITSLITRAIEMQNYGDHGTLVTGTTNVGTAQTIGKPSVNGSPLF